MSYQFHDEMISAYLDGELTADERALVEQELAKSPQHQRVLDELRALQVSFQSFPSHRLDEKFGDRVLRAAERRMLTENSNFESAPANVGPATIPVRRSVDGTNGGKGTWQIAAGSVGAVAALLLLTLFLANRNEPTPEVSNISHRHKAANNNKQVGNRGLEEDEALSAELPADHRKVEASESGASFHTTGDPQAGQIVGRAEDSSTNRAKRLTAGPAARPAESRMLQKMAADANLHEGGMGGGAGPVSDQEWDQFRAPQAADAAGDRPTTRLDGSGDPSTTRTQPADGATVADLAGGQDSANADEGSKTFVYTIVVDVPIDQFARQPVEVALASFNVLDADKLARTDALRKSFADETPRPLLQERYSAQSAGRKLDRTADDDDDPQSAGEQPASELLVVATDAEVKAVCETLNRQGFKVSIGSQELARQVDLLPRGGKTQFDQQSAAAGGSAADAKNEAAGSQRRQTPRVGKVAEAEKASAEPAPTNPTPAEDRPGANKQADGASTGAPRSVNSRGRAEPSAAKESVERSETDNSRFSLKGSAYGAATEADAGPTRAPGGVVLEKQMEAEVAESYFFRVVGGERTAGVESDEERKQDAPQQPAMPIDLAKKQNGLADRVDSSPLALGIETADADEKDANEAKAASRMRVRFIIRPTP